MAVGGVSAGGVSRRGREEVGLPSVIAGSKSVVDSVDAAKVVALQEAVKDKRFDVVRSFLWDDSSLVKVAAVVALKKSVPEVDEIGRVDMEGTSFKAVQDDLERVHKFGSPGVAAVAFAQLTALNRDFMKTALQRSLGPKATPGLLREAEGIVEKVLETSPDESPKEFEQVAEALEKTLGRLVTVSDLQLKGDSLQLARKVPLALAVRKDFDVDEVLTVWAGRFNRVQSDFPITGEPILLIYGSCVDRTYDLNQSNVQDFINTGLKAVADREYEGDVAKATEAIKKVVDAPRPPDAVTNATEFMGVLIRRMKMSGDDKASVKDRKIDLWIDETFGKFRPVDKPGGASANVASNLSREPNVVVAVEHNHKMVARLFRSNVRRFSTKMFDDSLDVLLAMSDDTGDNPLQINHPVEFNQGLTFQFAGQNITSIDNGRMIYGASGVYQGDVKCGQPSSFLLDDRGEPITDENMLRKIGSSFRKVMFNGQHYVTDFGLMKKQINGVKAGGAVTHVELSGIKSSDLSKLKYLTGVIKGTVDSIGFNDDETVSVIRALKQQGEKVVVDEGKGPEATLSNAMQIAKALDVSRLYIHGQDFDLILRRDASEQDLQAEVVGGMWQKYQIYKKLTGEPLMADVGANMKVEGVETLMQVAARLTAGLTQDTLTEFAGVDMLEPQQADAKAAEMIGSITRNGFIQNKSKGGYSVVLLPPKWIYGERKVYPTGAGDTASGNQFNYSGMYPSEADREGWYERAHIASYF